VRLIRSELATAATAAATAAAAAFLHYEIRYATDERETFGVKQVCPPAPRTHCVAY
jgi:hypothetical protein